MLEAGALDRLERTYVEPIPTPWKLLVQFRLKSPSAPLKEIATALGFAPTTVYLWVKNPKFQRYEDWVLRNVQPDIRPEELAARRAASERIKEKFETHAEEMQDRLLAILETVDDPKLQKDICFEWLGHAGYGVQKAQANRSFALVVSEEMLQTFLTRASEAGLLPVIDVNGSTDTQQTT